MSTLAQAAAATEGWSYSTITAWSAIFLTTAVAIRVYRRATGARFDKDRFGP